MKTKEKSNFLSRLSFFISMIIFGFIGYVNTKIGLSPTFVVACRGIVGGICLFLGVAVVRSRVERSNLKEGVLLLILSGILLSANWILLSEAYSYTSVAKSTLFYYVSPIFVLIVSPILFNERLSVCSIIGVLMSFVGLMFISKILRTGFNGTDDLTGIALSVLSAILYSTVILINKKVSGIPGMLKAAIQVTVSGLIMLPYVLLFEDVKSITFDRNTIMWLAVLCVVCTGLGYFLYFGSMSKLKAKTISLMSYFDPLVAVGVSYFILKEQMDKETLIGCGLIVLAALIGEISFGKKHGKEKNEKK